MSLLFTYRTVRKNLTTTAFGLFIAPAATQSEPDQAPARNSLTPRPSLRRNKARRVTPSA